MKHSLKTSKPIQYASLLILLVALVFSALVTVSPAFAARSVSQTAIANYLAAQSNPTLTDQQKVKAAIDAYFTTRYEGQKLLQPQEFSVLTEDNTQSWVKKENDKREVELYLASHFDLNYQSYKYTLDYDSLTINGKNAVVQLREGHKVVFAAIAPQVSEMAGLQHVFRLHNKKGMWVIYTDEYQDDLSQEFEHMTKSDIKKVVDENYQAELKRKSSIGLEGKVLASLAAQPLGALTSVTYNRTAAKSYASTYWNDVTYTPYYRIDPSGADCSNFVAQAINAGLTNTPPPTVPTATVMGATGTYSSSGGDANWSQQWYYKFDTYTKEPTKELAYSASYAWINVVGQHSFITGNTGSKKGPAGTSSTTNFCSLQVGDIVQIATTGTGGPWDHEGIVVQILQTCIRLSDYLVDAHTNPHQNYPLSNWATYPMRYVHITGGYK